jgi:hypothetical protein
MIYGRLIYLEGRRVFHPSVLFFLGDLLWLSQPMYLVPLSPPLSTSSPTLGHNDNEQDQKDVNPMTMSSIKKLEEETMQLRKRLAELELAMANLKKVDFPINVYVLNCAILKSSSETTLVI